MINFANKKFKTDTLIFFWFVLSLFILFSGHRYSSDSTSKFESARAFMTTGSFNLSDSENGWGRKDSEGNEFTYFTFGSVLLMFPPAICIELLHLISGKTIPEEISSFCITFQNLIITALIGLLLFKLFRIYNFSYKQSFYYSTIIVFGSQILQYSSTGWSEPGAFLFSLAGFYYINKDSGKWILLSVFFALVILIRIEFAIYAIVFISLSVLKNNLKVKMLIKMFISFGLILSLQLIFNYIRYHNVLDFGYFSFTGSTSKAGYSLSLFARYIRSFFYSYLSFGRLHFFWVSPLILLNILIPFHWNGIPQKIKIAYISSLITLLIIPFAGYNSWCWGNRYIYLYFPYLLITIFFIKNITLKIYFRILLIFALIINALSTLVNSHVVQEILANRYGAAKSIELSAANFTKTTFLYHIKLFPDNLISTFKLLISMPDNKTWEWFRYNCLDIWPVGLSAFSQNPYIPFLLWITVILLTIIYYKKVIIKILK